MRDVKEMLKEVFGIPIESAPPINSETLKSVTASDKVSVDIGVEAKYRRGDYVLLTFESEKESKDNGISVLNNSGKFPCVVDAVHLHNHNGEIYYSVSTFNNDVIKWNIPERLLSPYVRTLESLLEFGPIPVFDKPILLSRFDRRMDVPRGSEPECVERLRVGGWNVMSWQDYVDTDFDIVGGDCMGLYRAGSSQLRGVAYNPRHLIRTVDDSVIKAARLRDRFEWELKNVWYKNDEGELRRIMMEVRLVACSTECPSKSFCGRQEGKLYVTRPRKSDGKIGYVVSRSGFEYVSGWNTPDKIQDAVNSFNEHLKFIVLHDKTDLYWKILSSQYDNRPPVESIMSSKYIEDQYRSQCEKIFGLRSPGFTDALF